MSVYVNNDGYVVLMMDSELVNANESLVYVKTNQRNFAYDIPISINGIYDFP